MSNFTDANYLKGSQYNNADKLAARIRLHELFSTNPMNIYRWEFDFLLDRLPAEAKILEVGCGRGDLWKHNADRIPPAWQITLTDLSAGMLDDCKRHLGDFSGRFQFQEADAEKIPFEPAQFDGAVASMMLYHVPDRAKAIAELRRILKPSGILFAMTNGDNHMKELYLLGAAFEEDQAVAANKNYGGIYQDHFGLQNGAEQLQRQFAQVEQHIFENALEVTQVEPLLDYIRSMIERPETAMLLEKNRAMAADLAQRIEKDGAIHIQKETGIFIAQGIKG